MWNVTSQERESEQQKHYSFSESNQTLQIFGATTAIDKEVNPQPAYLWKAAKNFKRGPELKNASLTYPHEIASPLVIINGPSQKLQPRHRWKRQLFWKLKLCWNETTYKMKLRTFPLNTEMVPHSLTIRVQPIKTFFFHIAGCILSSKSFLSLLKHISEPSNSLQEKKDIIK